MIRARLPEAGLPEEVIMCHIVGEMMPFANRSTQDSGYGLRALIITGDIPETLALERLKKDFPLNGMPGAHTSD
jgi:hypothetical protein